MFTRRHLLSFSMVSGWKKVDAKNQISLVGNRASSQISTIASVAELRDLSPEEYETVIVRGNRTGGDGGGGIFYWRRQETLADDGGCVLRPSVNGAGAWVREINSSISVKWWGATGDGTTDDTEAFQRAIYTAQRLGREIYVPAGTFRITRSLKLQRIVTIRGAGRATTTIKCIVPRPMIIWSGPSHFSDQSGFISDISLDGSDIASEGIVIGWGADFTLTKCAISNINGPGLVLHATQNSYFSQVQVQYCKVNLLLTNGAWNNAFSRCEFNQPADRGYNILSKNFANYITLTGDDSTIGNSRHNSFYACVIERGAPTQVIRLEDDQGDNSFIGCEIYGGGSGTPQIVLFGNNDYFGQGTTVQRGTLAPSLAFETYGFATRLDGIILIGWANLNWAKAHDLLICNYVTGDGNGSGAISTAGKLVSQDYGFANGRTFAVLNDGLRASRSTDGAPAVVEAGASLLPIKDSDSLLGTESRPWKQMSLSDSLHLHGSSILAGEVDPEGMITAPKGSLFLRNNSEDGIALYVKEAGSGPNGWKPK